MYRERERKPHEVCASNVEYCLLISVQGFADGQPSCTHFRQALCCCLFEQQSPSSLELYEGLI